MNVYQAAAQHLAQQGAAFEGRSRFLQRSQDLQPEEALKRAQQGRPLTLRIQDESFSVAKPQDLVELDFFKAQGPAEGLKDPRLAEVLRELPLGDDNKALLAYRTLSTIPNSTIYVQPPEFLNGRKMNRDQILAMGFLSGKIDQLEELAQPALALSLKEMHEAGVLAFCQTPSELYAEAGKKVFVQAPNAAGVVSLSPEQLQHPDRIHNSLEQLSAAESLRARILPKSHGLPQEIQSLAWSGKLDMEGCQSLLEEMSEMKQGEHRIFELLLFTSQDQDKLPTPQQIQQYKELREKLPAAPIQSPEFSWLTADSDKFPSRLEMLAEYKTLTASDRDWHERRPSSVQRLENAPHTRALVQQLQAILPLEEATFQLACSVPEEQQSQFVEVYRQAHEQGLIQRAADFSALWADCGQHFAQNHERLLKSGMDERRALLAAAAMSQPSAPSGEGWIEPDSSLIELAQQLECPAHGYSSNPFAEVIKRGTELSDRERHLLLQAFGGRSLENWRSTWQNLQSDGRVEENWVEILQTMREVGLPDHELTMMRLSGTSPKTLLQNLRETPDQRALRAQRWVAHATRGMTQSQARLSGLDLARQRELQQQKDELRDLDHWYIPTQEYCQALQDHEQASRANASYRQGLRQRAQEWDQKLAQLQSGQIPWGEPPVDAL